MSIQRYGYIQFEFLLDLETWLTTIINLFEIHLLIFFLPILHPKYSFFYSRSFNFQPVAWSFALVPRQVVEDEGCLYANLAGLGCKIVGRQLLTLKNVSNLGISKVYKKRQILGPQNFLLFQLEDHQEALIYTLEEVLGRATIHIGTLILIHFKY